MAPADLFAAALAQRLAQQAPLAERLRPRSLDEIVGQRHLLGKGRPLRALIEADRLSSVVLWGPPGVGKTTLARLVAGETEKAFVALSAVTAGVKDVRDVIDSARRRLGEYGRGTILFLDEVHRFNRAQQDALLPAVEDGSVVLIGATTENPYVSINAPLLSRSTLFRLRPLTDDDIREVVARGLRTEGAAAEPDAVDHLVARVDGDARAVLTAVEVAVALARSGADARAESASTEPADSAAAGATSTTSTTTAPPAAEAVVSLADAEAALDARALRFGPDAHYDQISAFIKSIRGSDPDAGLYWLARLLAGGEDARFIARRLLILAAEDVGLADPMSLVVTEAAARAVEYVGLPEARLHLAQAVVHLALAPKSNSIYAALGRAEADVESMPAGEVPAHLRDASYRGARQIGHGVGYKYPHDRPDGWVDQLYLPRELRGRRYYEGSDHGREPELVHRWMARTGQKPDELAGAADPQARE